MICNGCGGVVGRDCFNPSECEWIAHSIDMEESYNAGKKKQQEIDYYKSMEDAYYRDMKDSAVTDFLTEIINTDTASDYLKNKAKSIIEFIK